MARKIYVDVDTGKLVSGLNDSTTPQAFGFEGDNSDYELYFLQPRGASAGNYYEPVDYSARSIRLNIGAPPPSTATAYVATTAGAWSNLPSVVSATLTRAVTGSNTANEEQLLSFVPDAIGGTFAISFPSQLLTFTAVSAGVFTTSGTHGLATGQGFVVTGFGAPTGGLVNDRTYYVAQIVGKTQFFANTTASASAITSYSATTAGTGYTITATSTAIDGTATVAVVQNACEAMPAIGQGNVRVTGTAGRSYRFTFINEKGQAALPLMTVAQALTPIYGKTGTLNFNTLELLNAISASANIDAVLEIETAFSGKTETAAQDTITIYNDIITSTSPAPVPAITPTSSFNLIAPDSNVWSVSIDNDGVLTATKQ
jgi:hypothetical protein